MSKHETCLEHFAIGGFGGVAEVACQFGQSSWYRIAVAYDETVTQPASGTGTCYELCTALTTSISTIYDYRANLNNIDTTYTNKMSEGQQTSSSNDVQHAESQGRDPNTEGPDHPKMTGTGQPGSHSAFFGLTPDGSKDENTQAGTTPVKPAHSKEASNSGTASGGGTYTEDDVGSRGVTGSGVADQVGVCLNIAGRH